MKKNLLIFLGAILIAALTAYGLLIKDDTTENSTATALASEGTTAEYTAMSLEDIKLPDFYFGVNPRFANNYTKTKLSQVKAFSDLLDKDHAESILRYKSLSITLLDDADHTNTRFEGATGTFTNEQLAFLKQVDYSANFLIRADHVYKNPSTGIIEDNYSTQYITVMPEKLAVYSEGNDALVAYLQNACKSLIATIEKRPDAGKLYFTVSKDGKIKDVHITVTSGYPEIDAKASEALMSLPGSWEAAENASGEKIDQTLVVSLGNQGC